MGSNNTLKVPKGYEEYKRMKRKAQELREQFERETEWKTKAYIV